MYHNYKIDRYFVFCVTFNFFSYFENKLYGEQAQIETYIVLKKQLIDYVNNLKCDPKT